MIEYENLNKLNKVFEAEYLLEFRKFLDKGWYVLGDQVKQFESSFAAYCGTEHCIGLASGLDALLLSLLALDLPKGSEVIVPSNTYIATILSIVNAGLKPILVEPDIHTYNIDPANIESHITSATKVIMVVHLYGKPCDMPSIKHISDRYNIHIVEDCAQAHGAIIGGLKVGSWGTFGAFSFYPTKNLGALGDAGAITTNDDSFASKIRALRNYGSFKKYYNDYIGFNSRLDELQAVFLNIKLRHLDDINSHKQKLAAIYKSNINNSELILPVALHEGTEVFHIFPVRTIKRDALKTFLEQQGIKTEIHYPVAPHHQAAYNEMFKSKSYPVSEEIHRTELSLPISYFHTESEIMQVCETINNFK